MDEQLIRQRLAHRVDLAVQRRSQEGALSVPFPSPEAAWGLILKLVVLVSCGYRLHAGCLVSSLLFFLNSLFEAGRSHWVRLHLSMSIIAVLQSKSAWWKLGRAKRILSRSDSMPDERQVDFKGSNLWRCHHFCSKRRPLAVRWIHIGISMPGHSVKHCLMSVGGNLMNPSACLWIILASQGVARCGGGKGLSDPRTGLSENFTAFWISHHRRSSA